MKLRNVFLIVVALLAVQSCTKEDDFEALRHPILLEGDFDPVWGLPVAKMSANIGDLVGMLDTNSTVEVYIDNNDLVSFRYADTFYNTFDQFGEKKAILHTKGEYDTLRSQNVLSGSLDIPLYQSLDILENGTLQLTGLYFTLTAQITAFVNDSLMELFRQGVRIYFDSISLRIQCQDGFTPTIDLGGERGTISTTDLIEGQDFTIFDNFDIGQLLNHKPIAIQYAMRMNMAIPIDQWELLDPDHAFDSLGVDSITSVVNAFADFPLQLYCRDISYTDTIPIDLPMDDIDTILNEVERYLTLDSTSCIIIETQNHLPLNLHLNTLFLDENMHPVTRPLFASDSIVYGAPLVPLGGESFSYVSGGSTKSRIVVPITLQLAKDLRRARHMQFSLGGSTSTLGAQGSQPTIVVRGQDKVDLKAYIVLAPHVHLATDPFIPSILP